jgi:hypothetical protein
MNAETTDERLICSSAVRPSSSAKSTRMEIDRVPRNADEEAALLRKRPDGWEFLLFAAILRRRMARLESKFRDHELGYVEPQGPMLDEHEAIRLLREAFHKGGSLGGNVERVLEPRAQELAFGALGEPSDPERIDHLAERLIDIYEAFLDWGASLRGTAVPDECERAFALASSFLDGPIRQMREFVDRVVGEVDLVPARLREGDPIRMTLTLTISIDEAVTSSLHDEMRRLEELEWLSL